MSHIGPAATSNNIEMWIRLAKATYKGAQLVRISFVEFLSYLQFGMTATGGVGNNTP